MNLNLHLKQDFGIAFVSLSILRCEETDFGHIFDEFSGLLEGVVASPSDRLLVGDFNSYRYIVVQNYHHATTFVDIIESFDLKLSNMLLGQHMSLGTPLT